MQHGEGMGNHSELNQLLQEAQDDDAGDEDVRDEDASDSAGDDDAGEEEIDALVAYLETL